MLIIYKYEGKFSDILGLELGIHGIPVCYAFIYSSLLLDRSELRAYPHDRVINQFTLDSNNA